MTLPLITAAIAWLFTPLIILIFLAQTWIPRKRFGRLFAAIAIMSTVFGGVVPVLFFLYLGAPSVLQVPLQLTGDMFMVLAIEALLLKSVLSAD